MNEVDPAIPTHWPDSASEVPLEVVSRLIYASQSRVDGPVLDEMRRIRNHAVRHNQPAGIRVALLHMCGWFVEWIEGPEDGIRALLERVSRDARHHNLQVLHQSMGKPRLFRPWIGTIVQGDDGAIAFASRVSALKRDHSRGRAVEPASAWLRLCSPPAHDMPEPSGFARAMLLSARRSLAFDLLHFAAQAHQRKPVQRRFAGSADDAPDVESDYLDLPHLGHHGLRLIANARKGLAMGMTHAVLPDHGAVVLLLDASAAHNQRLIERVLLACRQVHHVPLIVGVGAPAWVTDELQELVERQGLAWLGVPTATGEPGPRELWASLAPALGAMP
jgi:hypothetical protein